MAPRETVWEWYKENDKDEMLGEWNPTKNGEIRPDSV